MKVYFSCIIHYIGRLSKEVASTGHKPRTMTNHFIRFLPCQRSGVKLNQGLHEPGKRLVTGGLYREPEVVSPGFKLVRVQGSPNGRRGNGLDNAIGSKFADQFRAVPMGEGASHRIRPFTGELDHLEDNLWQEYGNAPWARLLYQACCSLYQEAFGPFAKVVLVQANPCCRSHIAMTLFEEQHGLGASDNPNWCSGSKHPVSQGQTGLVIKPDLQCATSPWHSHLPL